VVDARLRGVLISDFGGVQNLALGDVNENGVTTGELPFWYN
jgi:hypothetical protein